jgi:hypothetical protein
MAIQVGGTNVITNGRALNNITSIDSTTAAAIGSGGVGGGWDIPTSATYSVSGGSTNISAGLYLVTHIMGYYSGSFTRNFTSGSNKIFVGLAGNDLSTVNSVSGSTIELTGGAYSKLFGWFMTDSTATFRNDSTTAAFLWRLQS